MLRQSGVGSKNLQPRLTYSVREAAAILGVGAATLYRAVGRGEVPAIPVGRRRVIPKRWVDEQLSR